MIFDKNVILKRQKNVADALNSLGVIVIVGSGESITKPGGLDQTYPFLPHPEFYWLSGSRRSGEFMVYEPDKGWTHFIRPLDLSEKLWEGDKYVSDGTDVAKLHDYLKRYQGKSVVVLGNLSEVPFSLSVFDKNLNDQVRDIVDSIRRKKDQAEIDLMAKSIVATRAGFQKAREFIRPGVSERAIQIELEAEFFRHGAQGTSFDTIVGAGSHSAVLHFSPSDRIVQSNDLVLLDAGVEIFEYSSDVTRTFSAQGRFTPEQQEIYDLVLAAQLKAISLCKKNIEWREVHRAAALVITSGLRQLDILCGSDDELTDDGAVSLFFPHGIGHMLGLRVRDVGGHNKNRSPVCCGANLRVDIPLQEGFVMTTEPGIYFIPAMLDNIERREKFKKQVNWDKLERWRNVGGVRIEDDILITSAEPQVLTASIPK